MELVFLVDLGGIDFAVTFLMIYLSTICNLLVVKFDKFKRDVSTFFLFLADLYMFRPKTFVSHVSASSVLVALTCSVFLTCLLWVPVIYLSTGFIT